MVVYRLRGDSITVFPDWAVGEEKRDHDFFYAERGSTDPECRLKAANMWKSIRLVPFADTAKKDVEGENLPDAINITYIYHGIGIIVSEHAKQLLEPFLQNECVFLPMILENSSQRYWVLYITKILDCLDEERSKFGRISPKSIRKYFFHEEMLENTYLFRLPGFHEYLDSNDFATQSFLDLVQRLNIHGFEFWECNKPGQDPIVT